MSLYRTCGQCQQRNSITALRCPCGQPLTAYRPTGSERQAEGISPASVFRRAAPAPLRPRHAEHYIARYWRGELSLAHSFWISNVLVDLTISLIQYVLTHRVETSSSPLTPYRANVLTLYLQMFVVSPWQMVGLWRSARRRLEIDECRRFWPRAAQGLVLVSLFGALVMVPFWLPGYLEAAKIALNTDKYRFTLTPSADGNMIQLDGGIGLGLAQALTRQLKDHPGVEIIALKSTGGLLDEAAKVQALIEQRGLSTYVSESCQSACANIFLAGAQRLLQKDATLGFHRGYWPGLPDAMSQGENPKMGQYFLARGVAAPFVDKVVHTPPYEMWVPTPEQLIEAGVVTEVIEGSQVVAKPKFLTIAGSSSPSPEPAPASRMLVAFPKGSGGVSLELPGFQVKTDEMKADGRRYLMASHPETGLIVSVTLERGLSPATRQGCITHLAQLKTTPFVARSHDVSFDQTSPVPRLEYTIAEEQGVHVEQKNVRNCLAQNNIYADLHVSKVLYTAADRALFEAVLNSVLLVDRPATAPAVRTAAAVASLELFKQGSVFYLQQQYAKAIPIYQQALDLEKESRRLDTTIWRVLVDNLGMAYGMTGHLAEAKVTFEYGLALDPTYPMFHYNMACTYAELQQPEDAMRALDAAFQYRRNVNPEERLPDPRRDSSFQSLMARPDFRALVERMMATAT